MISWSAADEEVTHWLLLSIVLQVGNPTFWPEQRMNQQLCGTQPSLQREASWIPKSPTTVSGGVCMRVLHQIPFVYFISDVSLFFVDLNSTHIVSFFLALFFLCGLVGVIYFCYKRYKYVCGMPICCFTVWNLTRFLFPFSLIPGGHQTRRLWHHQKRFPWMCIHLRRLNTSLPFNKRSYKSCRKLDNLKWGVSLWYSGVWGNCWPLPGLGRSVSWGLSIAEQLGSVSVFLTSTCFCQMCPNC